MFKFTTILRSTLMGVLLLAAQACTKESLTPTPTPPKSGNVTSLSDKPNVNRLSELLGPNVQVKHESYAAPKAPVKNNPSSATAPDPTTNLEAVCYDHWDVYFNLMTGEEIGREYTGRTCTGGDGPGGGGDGGTGTGGGGGGTGTGTGVGPNGQPYVESIEPLIGDHSVLMKIRYDMETVIDVVLEYTESNHTVDKITLTTQGVTYGTSFAQVGNGIASYVGSHNFINYSVNCQFTAGTVNTGPIANGSLFQVYGTYRADLGTYNIHIKKL